MPKAKTPATTPPRAAPAAQPPSHPAPAAAGGAAGPVDTVQSRGPRARLRDIPDPAKQIVAYKVFCNVTSKRSLIAMPLHEIPLAQRKLEIMGQELTIDPSWPDTIQPREKAMEPADLQNEYERLKRLYAFAEGDGEDSKYDLLTDLYGRPHEGRLVAVMRRQHAAYKEMVAEHRDDPDTFWSIEEWQSLVDLAKPEQDFIIPNSPLQS